MTQFRTDIGDHLVATRGVAPGRATLTDWRFAVIRALRDRVVAPWLAAESRAVGGKRVAYLSMEFLVGRLLEDALLNTGLRAEAEAALAEHGVSLAAVLESEPDAALGNGGLGRLAACFLESLSTLGIPATGYGIRYEHGLFRQDFAGNRQVEEPETWLDHGNPWEFARPERSLTLGFGGHVFDQANRAIWRPHELVRAEPADTPVIGWGGTAAAKLRLWQARPFEVLDLERFNAGHHAAAAMSEAEARSISRVLYPDDSTPAGLALRLKQEYFFTAASLRDVLSEVLAEGASLTDLPRRVAIQLNDTHPAIAGPELVRLLHDEKGLDFATSVETARATLSYTNHTLLPEALERWSEEVFGALLPRHLQIIDRIDALHRDQHPGVAIREHGQVKMGELSFVMAHRVNGVSALHTELMKRTVFADLHAAHPDRIVNQTNGVTPRRWLNNCNPPLAALISSRIGPDWVGDAERLADLEPLVGDAAFREDFRAAKRRNKVALADWLGREMGAGVDPDAMFDVQVKRIHEYKRQHLAILETIALWLEMRDAPSADWTPRLRIFGGKAAPGYVFAKEIIHLIRVVSRAVNDDPVTSRWLRVLYPPNYNVTMAERLIPAADLSEQISTAGKEASGTGNMKFALNGAVTIGTLDGANVEIRERVGAENFFLFGMTADEVFERRKIEDHAARAIEADPRLARALAALTDGTLVDDDRFAGIAANVAGPDYFLVASDFTDYWRASREAETAYRDADGWSRMAAANVARSGWFSSDRTIRGYASDIWGVVPPDSAERIAAE